MNSINGIIRGINIPKTKLLLSFFLLIVLIRCICITTMGLTPQDAYYYYYSQELSLSYFDHPPMIAWMLRFFTFLLGKQIFVIKLADFTVTILSLYAFYHLAKLFLSGTRVFNSILLLGSTFLVTVLSISSAPDVPLILFWTISLIFLFKAIFEEKKIYWPLAGLAMGFAFDSKYTAVFLLAGLFVFLVFSPSHRKLIFSKYTLQLAVCFLIAILPVVIWNVQHDYISFKFQTEQRAEGVSLTHLYAGNFFGTIGHQLFILLPVFFISVFVVIWKLIQRKIITHKAIDDKKLFLISFSLPVLAFFFSVAIFDWVKLNWMMPAYISAAILVATYIKQKYLKAQLIVSVSLHLLLLVQVIFYPVAVKSDDTWWGWDKLSRQVEVLQGEYPNYFVFSDDGYKTSAVLNFYNYEKVYAGNVLGENALQFSLRDNDLSLLKGKNAIFIDSEPGFTNDYKGKSIPEKLRKHFSSVEEIDPIILRNIAQKPVRKFRIYKCSGYIF